MLNFCGPSNGPGYCIHFLLLQLTSYYKFRGFNNTDLLSYSFSDWKSFMGFTGMKSRCYQGCVPSERSRGESTSLYFAEGFPGSSGGKESSFNAGDHLQCRRPGFDHWVEKIPWRRKWQPTSVFFPGKPSGQKSLAGYSP